VGDPGFGRALLPERSDERHENEASADADEEPRPEVLKENAESDTYDDPADKGRAAVGLTTARSRPPINRVRRRSPPFLGVVFLSA
jgi:hypothetical protein